MLEEVGEVVAIEFLERRELPEHRPELRPELGEARGEEALDEVAGLGERLLLGDETGAFHREDETVRRGGSPGAEALRTLQPVMRGVDLDRGELRRGVGELVRLLQALRVEDAAPRRVTPPADADADAP